MPVKCSGCVGKVHVPASSRYAGGVCGAPLSGSASGPEDSGRGEGGVTEEPPALAETVSALQFRCRPSHQAAAGVVLVSFAASPWCSGGHGAVGMIRRGDSPLGAISPCAIIGICVRLMPMSASM